MLQKRENNVQAYKSRICTLLLFVPDHSATFRYNISEMCQRVLDYKHDKTILASDPILRKKHLVTINRYFSNSSHVAWNHAVHCIVTCKHVSSCSVWLRWQKLYEETCFKIIHRRMLVMYIGSSQNSLHIKLNKFLIINKTN